MRLARWGVSSLNLLWYRHAAFVVVFAWCFPIERARADSPALDKYLKSLGPEMQSPVPRDPSVGKEKLRADLLGKWKAELEVRRNEAVQAGANAERYVREIRVDWEVTEEKNDLTDRTDVKINSDQIAGDVLAQVKGYCTDRGNFAFDASLLPADNQPEALSFPDLTSMPGLAGLTTFVRASRRINDLTSDTALLEQRDFANNFRLLKLMPLAQAEAVPDFVPWKWWQPLNSAAIDLPVNVVARLLAKIRTNRGDILIRIALADERVKKAIDSCMQRSLANAGK